jgi:hypothetical protein
VEGAVMIPTEVHGWLQWPVWERLPGVALRDRPFILMEDAHFYSRRAGQWIDIPAGYRSDLLSVPWKLRWLFPVDGPGAEEAWHHDWLCDMRPAWCPSKMAHAIFEEGLRLNPYVSNWRRWAKASAVKMFGPRWV